MTNINKWIKEAEIPQAVVSLFRMPFSFFTLIKDFLGLGDGPSDKKKNVGSFIFFVFRELPCLLGPL